MTDQTPDRKSEDYVRLGRTLLQNHLETEKNKAPRAGTVYRIRDFISKRIWTWLYYYVDSRFGKNHPYPDYGDAPDRGIYRMEPEAGTDTVTIALCADWATNTRESIHIAQRMKEQLPDYTIHLGDTYFVGEPKEVKRNFTDPGAPWVRGSSGSFAVLGNHEMYARGIAFFDDLLPTLGLRVNGSCQGQHAGFVCLENNHWRILVLDTGYHSIGKVPVLEMLPWFAPDSRFDDKLMDWLEKDVRLGDPADKRGIVVLSHHQYITAFHEGEFGKPAEQLATLIGKDRPVLWLWGHEHKFSMYQRAQMKERVTAYGRCIGHGGMPVEVDTFKLDRKKRGIGKLVVYDHRIHRSEVKRKLPLGYNGYAVLKLKGAELTVAYHDFFHCLVTEKWQVSPDGLIQGSIFPAADCPLSPVAGRRWEDAVR